VLATVQEITIDAGYISEAQSIEFPSENGRVAKALYYSPVNKDFQAPKDALPPLIVKSHGGPTGSASAVYDPKIQFWTSRGFAVIDVNYGGSTGYGRDYRELLKDAWGIVDREDCEHAAKYLIKENLVDPQKLFIRGGSAGGYTTLCALTFGDIFTGGASYYGVSDLEALAKETHKFESRYLDTLIAPYPEGKTIYKERSPINFVDRLSVPVIFFQGEEDQVVPSGQAKEMSAALTRQGIRNELILYPDEQHGFRQAETIQDSLQRELEFYLQCMDPKA
jgi:dipeptidyl aminopeptidase/acylaminoacyl peptidase